MESTPLYVGYPLLQRVDVTYADGSTATVTKGGMISPYLPMSPHISPSLPTGHQGRNDRAVCIRRRRGRIVPLGCRARRERSRRRPSASGVALEPEAGGWRVPPLPHGTRTHPPLPPRYPNPGQAAGASSVWGERDLYWLTASTDPSTRNDDRCQFGGGLFCCLRKYAVVTTGTSTIVDGLTKLLDVPLVGPLLPDWPKMAEQPEPPPSSRYRQGDGDLEGDILAQYNVLVRNVDHEVCFLNTSQPLAPRDKWVASPDAQIHISPTSPRISPYLEA